MTTTTPINDIPAIVAKVRSTFQKHVSKPLEWRLKQLKAIRTMVTENSAAFREALLKDLGHQSSMFWDNAELNRITKEVDDFVANAKAWTAPVKYGTPLLYQPGASYARPEPYGVALIISPWNYPVHLVLVPLIHALSAGNCAVIKPSEVSVHTSDLITALIRKYLDNDAVAVLPGGAEVSQALLAQRWDIIFYTGNTSVGRIVAQAAAKFLTPTILELGGKSPVLVATDSDVNLAARRICFGKLINSGQSCIAPDYILVAQSKEEALIAALNKTIDEFYGKDPRTSSDYSRMINERHTKRVQSLLDDPTIEIVRGGEVDVANRYIAPTILRAKPESKCMQEEIFGPLIPILRVKSVSEAIEFVNSREKPLALYLFTANKHIQEQVLNETSAGGVCLNDTIYHFAGDMPFGGVGESGMGASHGHAGFLAFTHIKPVYSGGTISILDPPIRYPPYSPAKLSQIKSLQALANSHMAKKAIGASVLAGSAYLVARAAL